MFSQQAVEEASCLVEPSPFGDCMPQPVNVDYIVRSNTLFIISALSHHNLEQYALAESVQAHSPFQAEPPVVDTEVVIVRTELVPGFNCNGLPTLPVIVPSQMHKARSRLSVPTMAMAAIPEQHQDLADVRDTRPLSEPGSPRAGSSPSEVSEALRLFYVCAYPEFLRMSRPL